MFKGSKYQEGLSTVEIAKLIRADIKQCFADGVLPAGLKVSIRSEKFSAGSAIDATIVVPPGGDKVIATFPAAAAGRYTPVAQKWLDTIKATILAYNCDNFGHPTDVNQTNFYISIKIVHDAQEVSP